MSKVTRRDFVKSAAAIGGFFILPSGLRAKPPSSKLTFALAGCGGNGRGNVSVMAGHPSLQVVAICDPDKNQMVAAQNQLSRTYPQKKFSCEMYQDHREMLSKMGDKLDCIFVSTPDHNHHPVTLEAMKQGKHVYTQKPLTNRIRHARELREVANKTGVVNRMGIILHPHGSGPMFYPESMKAGIKNPDLPNPKMNHTFDWIDACIAGKPSPWADFNYSAMLTETVLLGVIGNRFPGQKLEWDAKAMKFPNMPEADKLI